MSEEKIRVVIVTPVHNRRDITLQCLKSIARLNTENLEIYTIIVDDGSTDGTSEAIQKDFPKVEIVKGDGNLWFTEGTNVGIRAGLKLNPKYILLINDDQVFDANAIKYMVETAEKHPKSVVGSLLLLWDTPHRLFQTSPIWDTWSGGFRHFYNQTVWTIPEKTWEVDLIVGNCVLVPTEAIEKYGLMDSKRFPNFGDAEYTPRLQRKGYKLLIEPKARVFCMPNNIPTKVVKMSLRQKIDALIFNLGHIHNLRRRFYSTMAGSPTFWQGIMAYIVFFVRLALRKNAESFWAEKQTERPLKEVFANKVVN